MKRIGLTAATLCALLGAAPAAALGEPSPGQRNAVSHRVRMSEPRGFWTPRNRRRAAPLDPLRLGAGEAAVPDSRRSRASGGRLAGSDPGSSKTFPNSANGVVFGRFGADLYRCSGSAITSPARDLVMTSGHCALDAESGEPASNLIFVPGYRGGAEPFGEWVASSFSTTAKWQSSAGGSNPDEAGDIAFLRIAGRPSDSAALGRVVGSIGIRFHRRRRHIYAQYGYPSEAPYNGSRLFRLRSAFAGSDGSFSPATMAIRSDFTPGASGGPWTVGGGSPIALSVTDYSYGSLDGYLFGPYFGDAIRSLYVSVGGRSAGAAALRPAGAKPAGRFSLGRVTHHRARGTATILAIVPAAGRVALGGGQVRRQTREPREARRLRLPIILRPSARRLLHRAGVRRVRVTITYVPSTGGPRTRSRELTLLLRR